MSIWKSKQGQLNDGASLYNKTPMLYICCLVLKKDSRKLPSQLFVGDALFVDNPFWNTDTLMLPHTAPSSQEIQFRAPYWRMYICKRGRFWYLCFIYHNFFWKLHYLFNFPIWCCCKVELLTKVWFKVQIYH